MCSCFSTPRSDSKVAQQHSQPLYVSTAGVQLGGSLAEEKAADDDDELDGQVTLQVLDFSGQAEYMLMHRAFLGTAHSAAYVVVTNLTTHPQLRAGDRAAACAGGADLCRPLQ